MVSERVDIIINTKGGRVVVRDLEKIGGSAKRAGGSVDFLRRATLALGGGLVLRKLTQTVDAYNLLQNRLRVVTDTSEELSMVQENLFDIANRTRSGVEGVAQIYSRFALSLKDAGLETETLLNLTENVTKAAIVGGAATQEANQALIQLSQGLAAGALRGDELRSVLEQLPVVSQRLAKALGVSVGQLRKLGEQGAITRDVIIDAFGDIDKDLEDQFQKTLPTISQSFTVLGNKALEAAGAFDELTGASAFLSKILIFTSENLDIVAKGLAVIAVIGGAVLAAKVIPAMIAGLKGLGIALAANFGLVALGGILALVAGAVIFRKELGNIPGPVGAIGQAIDEMISPAHIELFRQLREDQRVFLNAVKNADTPAKTFNRNLLDEAAAIAQSNEKLREKIGLQSGTEAILARLDKLGRKATEAERAAVEATANKIQGLKREQAILQQQSKILVSLGKSTKDNEIAQAALTGLFKEGAITAQQYNTELQKLKGEGVDPLTRATAALDAQATDLLGVQKAAAQLLLDAKGPEIEFANRQKALNKLFAEGTFNIEQRDRAQRKLNEDMESFLGGGKGGGAGGVDGPLATLGKDITDFATQSEQVLVNAFTSAEDALVEFVQTGKFNFSSLVDSILADLTRLLARQALVALVGSLGGGAGGAASALAGALAGSRADGGPVQANRSFLVGERGPEIFTPSGNGNITPNGAGGGANVTVINVMDPAEVTAALATPEGEKTVINIIGRNREAVKRVVS